MIFVFDSSAMLAYLKAEKGGEVVRALLEDAEATKYAHAVNLCEVCYDFLRLTDAATAEAAVSTLKAAGIVELNDMNAAFWRDIALLIATHRSDSRRLALGDAFGVALARRLNADFVTADRGELEAVSSAQSCRINFIR